MSKVALYLNSSCQLAVNCLKLPSNHLILEKDPLWGRLLWCSLSPSKPIGLWGINTPCFCPFRPNLWPRLAWDWDTPAGFIALLWKRETHSENGNAFLEFLFVERYEKSNSILTLTEGACLSCLIQVRVCPKSWNLGPTCPRTLLEKVRSHSLGTGPSSGYKDS